MTELGFVDKQRVVDLITRQAGDHPVGPAAYLRDLVQRSSFPEDWRLQLSGVWSGDPRIDSRRLVDWCAARDVNPADPRVTTLGSLLRAFYEDLGLEARAMLTAVIVAHDLYRDEQLRMDLVERNHVPGAAPEFISSDDLPIPEPRFSGGEDVELERLLAPEPALLDVGFLTQAILHARSVCRVEKVDGQPLGTGSLVAPDLVLTCAHVLGTGPAANVESRAAQVVARFGCVTNSASPHPPERVFATDDEQPVVAHSPVDELDFALLRLGENATQLSEINPLRPDAERPVPGRSINILQHPGGTTMKLALSGNGIAEVNFEHARVLYVATTRGGSSGSPCFGDTWNVLALHRAERSRVFGSIREGVLMSAIQAESDGAF